MRHLTRIVALLGISLISLFITRPVLAFPPLPSSFYGTVKVNGANVPDSTLVKAWINGQAYAQGKTLTHKGESVYSLDIPGDDASTPLVEGGREGEVVVFTIGGASTGQTGTWKSGSNMNVNLSSSMTQLQVTSLPTATQTTQISAAQVTATSTIKVQSAPTKTQTAPVVGAGATASATVRALSGPTSTDAAETVPSPTSVNPITPTTQSTSIQPTPVLSTASIQSGPTTPPTPIQPAQMIPTAANLGNELIDSGKISVFIGIFTVSVLSILLWFIFGHKPKE
jgi:hypothetical protein